VNFRLAVDEAGKVTNCRIQSAIGGPDFEKAVCSKLMERIAFEPALDADRHPVKSYYTNKVLFHIPGSDER
jgi:hypothetical protein